MMYIKNILFGSVFAFASLLFPIENADAIYYQADCAIFGYVEKIEEDFNSQGDERPKVYVNVQEDYCEIFEDITIPLLLRDHKNTFPDQKRLENLGISPGKEFCGIVTVGQDILYNDEIEYFFAEFSGMDWKSDCQIWSDTSKKETLELIEKNKKGGDMMRSLRQDQYLFIAVLSLAIVLGFVGVISLTVFYWRLLRKAKK